MIFHRLTAAFVITVLSVLTLMSSPPISLRAPRPVASASTVEWGMWLPNFQVGGGTDNSAVTGQEAALGHPLNLVHWYAADSESWSYDGSIVQDVEQSLGSGHSPMITWEFWNYSVAQISSGAADGYLKSWAAGMASYAPAPIYVRIFHEFNDPRDPSAGSGYPWGICGGTSYQASDLVSAYRHIINLFRSNGATNVKFIWNPDGTFSSTSMYSGSGCPALSAAYPGDSYIDYIGFDDYDYDTRSLYPIVSAVSSRPMILGEVGSNDSSGGPAFVNDFASGIADGSYSRLMALVWFNQDRWTLQSNPSTQAAVRTLVAATSPNSYFAYFNWYDNASPGMLNDNLHLVNPGTSTVTGTAAIPSLGLSQPFAIAPGAEQIIHFPTGTIGGPIILGATQPIVASQRVQFYGSFNEVPAQPATAAANKVAFNWFDKASPGMSIDNIHILNPGTAPATGTVSLPGISTPFAVGAGGETYVSFPQGTIGGPVVVNASTPVIASQRVSYYQTFNEVIGRDPATAATKQVFAWYDKASPGMWNNNVHILNLGAGAANGTVSVAGATINFSAAPNSETYVSFPQGTIGGPVAVNASAPVVASQRVAFYQSFNEISAWSPTSQSSKLVFPWYDKASPGMWSDNIHLVNVGTSSVSGTISIPGIASQTFDTAPGGETVVTFPQGTIGGPVVVQASAPILASQRVAYFQTFNEVAAT